MPAWKRLSSTKQLSCMMNPKQLSGNFPSWCTSARTKVERSRFLEIWINYGSALKIRSHAFLHTKRGWFVIHVTWCCRKNVIKTFFAEKPVWCRCMFLGYPEALHCQCSAHSMTSAQLSAQQLRRHLILLSNNTRNGLTSFTRCCGTQDGDKKPGSFAQPELFDAVS